MMTPSSRWLLLPSLAFCTLTGCSLLFPLDARGLPEFAALAPQTGAPIKHILVTDLDGKPVDIADVAHGQPTVLQLGSYSCPVFRYRRFEMQELMLTYEDRVRFLVIYTQEAHPDGFRSPYRDAEWDPLINRVAGIRLDQPETAEHRRMRAAWAKSVMSHAGRFLVDDMDNSAWVALGKAPSAAWVIDATGKVRLAQPWVDPEGIAQMLDTLLTGTISR